MEKVLYCQASSTVKEGHLKRVYDFEKVMGTVHSLG